MLSVRFFSQAWPQTIPALLLVLALTNTCTAFIDDEIFSPTTPFELTYSPERIVTGITENVKLRCAYEERESTPRSRIIEISRIRILKKEDSGWRLLAEKRDLQVPEEEMDSFVVAGKISRDIKSSFLEVTFPVATEETSGVFVCNVIGFDTHLTHVDDRTAEVTISEEKATTADLFTLLQRTEKKFTRRLAEQAQRMDTIDASIESVSKNLASVEASLDSRIEGIASNTASLADVDSLTENMTALTGTMRQIDQDVAALQQETLLGVGSLMAWPGGSYALLQPRAGCPRDLAFLGRPESHARLHTELTDNRDSHSSALSPVTKVTIDGKNFLTLRFCEASHVTGRAPWPKGSYCVNKLRGQDCPAGFTVGAVHLDTEDSVTADDYAGDVAGNAVTGNAVFSFCCMEGESPFTDMEFPTGSQFMLYRRGGKCQVVKGMELSEEYISIDTEDSINQDFLHGHTPDIDITHGRNTHLYLCHYRPTS